MSRPLAVAAFVVGTAAAVALVVTAFAVAAPVPKPKPPIDPSGEVYLSLGTARIVDEKIEFTTTLSNTNYTPDGSPATFKSPATKNYIQKVSTRQTTMVYSVKWTKVTTADGRELNPSELAKRLGEGAPAAVWRSGTDPEWRKLLAADTLYLEPIYPKDPRPEDGHVYPFEKKQTLPTSVKP